MNSLSYRIFIICSGAWRRRYAIAIPILVLPLFGMAISLMSPKIYSSHTSMLVQETAKLNPFLEDLAVSAMLKERIDGLNTLLHSRHILGAVARDRGLIDDKTSAASHDEIIAELSSSLTVQMLGKDLIRIDYKSDQPENMRDTLEVVSKQFVEQLLAPERSSMQDSSHFLTEHLLHRQRELDHSEAALAEYKNRHAADLPEMHVSNIAHLTKLKQRLSEREAELAGAKRELGGIDQQLSKTNPVLGRIEEQIVRIQGELALFRARYTDEHSLMQAALRNLARLKEERLNILARAESGVDVEQLWAIASSAPISNEDSEQTLLVTQLENLQLASSKVDGMREEIQSLRNMITELELKASVYGEKESELSKLERDLKVKRELYDDLLLRHENARITSSLGVFEQDKRIKVIDQPFTPTSPDNPPAFLFAIAGFVGGIFLGCGLALLLELSDTTLRCRLRLEAVTGVSVLSRVPAIAH